MLAVGIERDDHLGLLRQRVVDASLQRGALAEIERMADDRGARRVRRVGSRVARTVVDHDDGIARPSDLGHDAGNDGRLRYRPG